MRQDFPFGIFLIAFALYTVFLFVISRYTARNAGNRSFFSADRKAPWAAVAFGMVGASLSGVTFVSVPGNVLGQNFYYVPMIIGFIVGYYFVAEVLLPIYYKMNITSIYSYLEERFGPASHKTGTVFFMISRLLGAAVRVLAVAIVFFAFVPQSLYSGVPDVVAFSVVTCIFLLLLYLYTYKGGVKTIVWTDVLQTTFMLLAVFFTIRFVRLNMGWSFSGMISEVAASGYSKCFDWDWGHGTNAVKQFVAGILMTVAMTGLDQGMMQKNLACRDLSSSKKNMKMTAYIIAAVNIVFLLLGAVLSIFVTKNGGMDSLGIAKADEIFPVVASRYLGIGGGVIFLIGLISAAYPSVGASVTSLTSSFCIDFLHWDTSDAMTEDEKQKKRKWIQMWVTVLMFIIVVLLFVASNDSVINLIYKLASYTYGPLLGLFMFGIFTKYKVRDRAVPFIAVAAPVLSYLINFYCGKCFGFDLGFSLLLINGALTFIFLLFSRR